MLELKEDMISFKPSPSTWQEAIEISSENLIKEGYITKDYIDKMIENVIEFGPYIVIAPQIAMPHSRPEHGVIKGGFAITIFDDEVDVCGNLAKAFITLACSHDTQHLEMISMVAKSLDDDTKLNQFVSSKDKESIMKIFGGNNE